MNTLFVFLCHFCYFVVSASRGLAIFDEKEYWLEVLDAAVKTKYELSKDYSVRVAYWSIEDFSYFLKEEQQLKRAFDTLVQKKQLPQLPADSEDASYPQALMDMVKASIEKYFPDVDTSKVGTVRDSKQLKEACEDLIGAALKKPNFSLGETVKFAVFRLLYLYVYFKDNYDKRAELNAPIRKQESGKYGKYSVKTFRNVHSNTPTSTNRFSSPNPMNMPSPFRKRPLDNQVYNRGANKRMKLNVPPNYTDSALSSGHSYDAPIDVESMYNSSSLNRSLNKSSSNSNAIYSPPSSYPPYVCPPPSQTRSQTSSSDDNILPKMVQNFMSFQAPSNTPPINQSSSPNLAQHNQQSIQQHLLPPQPRQVPSRRPDDAGTNSNRANY